MAQFLSLLVLAVVMVFPAWAVSEQPYDEYEDSPTVYMEGCGAFPAVRLVIDDRETEARAFIRDGRTFLPARETLERLGGRVLWVGDQNAFYAQFPAEGRTVRVTVGSPIINIYRYNKSTDYGAGRQVQTLKLNTEPFRCEGRVFVPVRAAAEAAGGKIHYDKTANTVYAYSPKK